MAEPLNPAAPHHLPSFITAPGETDVLMMVMALILLGGVLGFGVFYFRLHALPERMAHKGQKLQFEVVAVLCLIALFTHMHIFWIAGLLLAIIDMPDFGTSLQRIAVSAEKVAGAKPEEVAEEDAAEPDLHASIDKQAKRPLPNTSRASSQRGHASVAGATAPNVVAPDGKELHHA